MRLLVLAIVLVWWLLVAVSAWIAWTSTHRK